MTIVPIYNGQYRVEKGTGYDSSKLKGSSVIITGGASGIASFFLAATPSFPVNRSLTKN